MAAKHRHITLDAGHGMCNRRDGVYDSGATKGRMTEEGQMYKWCRHLQKAISNTHPSWQAYLTRRKRNECVSRPDRVAKAQATHSDIFVSHHMDWAASPKVKGVSIYYYAEGPFAHRSEKLAVAMKRELTPVLKKWGSEFDNILPDTSTNAGSVYVLRHAGRPAILIELGFITSTVDAKNMVRRAQFRKELRKAEIAGMARYFRSHSS